tara:strand:- start:5016 stop:5804 length:789 start_codon:yes stop_codon:yes gene_type:complete
MLKKRIIPKLQLNYKQTYKGKKPILVVTKQFKNPRAIGDPLSQAKIYEAQLADELFLLDLERTNDSWEVLLSTLENMSYELATPLSAGGGIQTFNQVQELLERGADKVILNTAAVKNPNLIEEVANVYGSQCVVLSIDFKRIKPHNMPKVFVNAAQEQTDLEPLNWALEAINRGAGEIALNSINNDGMAKGLDLEITEEFSRHISVPLIIAGGCGLANHFVDGFLSGASAVAAGTFFCQRDQNPMQCRSQISNSGIQIRMGF